jgi:hypothetical protein
MGYTPLSIIKEDLSEVTSTASMDKSRESQEPKILGSHGAYTEVLAMKKRGNYVNLGWVL